MNINEMTKKQFEALPYLDDLTSYDIDSIILLPREQIHDCGFRIYEVIACLEQKPIGKCYGYDTCSIIMNSKWNRVGIDCLAKSGLMRIFLPTNEYELIPSLHYIKKKGEL